MKTILIVDDEADVRTVVGNRLKASGFRILEAAGAGQALKLAKDERPDLMLIDILMPGQDGIQLYHALERDPDTRGIPVIFLTALAQDIAVTRPSLELGKSYAILEKPHSVEVLLREVRKALGEN